MKKNFMKVAISLLCVMTLLFGSVLTFSIPASAATFTTIRPTKVIDWKQNSGWMIRMNVNDVLPETSNYYAQDAVPVVLKNKDGKVLGDFNDPANKLYSTFQRHGNTEMSAYIYAGNGYTTNNQPQEGDTITMAAGSYVSSNPDVGIKLEQDLVLFYSDNQWHLGREIDDSAELLTGMGMAPDWAQSATGLYTKVLQETNLTEVRTDGNIDWDTAKGNYFFPANYESGTFFNGNRFNVKSGDGLFYSAAASDLGFYITSFGTATVGDKVVMKGSFHSPNTGESFTLKMPITFTYAGDKNWCVTYDVAVPSGLREVNWSTFGINVGDTLTGGKGNSVTTSMNNSIFNVDVIFPTAAKWRFFGSETNSWLSADIAVDESGNLVFSNSGNPCSFAEQKTIYPAAVGLTSFIGTQFNLKIAVTDMSADGKSSYWNVWVNDQHVLGTTVRHTDGNAHGFGQTMECMSGTMTACATTKPVPAPPIPTPTAELTWSDFGLTPASTFSGNGWLFNGAGFGSVPNGYKFVGKVKLANNAVVNYGTAGLQWGFYVQQTGSGLTVGTYNGTLSVIAGAQTYTAPELGVTGAMADTEFTLSIQMWDVANNNKDARVAVWFNDMLLGVYDSKCTLEVSNNDGSVTVIKHGAITAIYDTTKTSTFTSYAPIPSDLQVISWNDYTFRGSSIPYGTELSFSGGTMNYKGTETNNLLFNGDIYFPSANDTQIYLFASTGWHGVHVNPNGATLQVGSGWGTAVQTFNAADFGLTSFEDVRLNLKASLTQNNGSTAMMRLWINDQFVTSMMLTDTVDAASINANFLPMQGAGATANTPCFIVYPTSSVIPGIEGTIPDATGTVTWADFANGGTAIYNTSYDAAGGAYAVYGWATNYDSLAGLKFAGLVKMSANAEIHYGGSDPSYGFFLKLQNDGSLKLGSSVGTLAMADGTELKDTFTAAELGISGNVADQRINVGFQMWDVTGKAARVAVWVNDTLLGVYDFTVTYDGATVSDAIALMYGAFEVGPEPATIEIPEPLGTITWSDFGVTSSTAYSGDWLSGHFGSAPANYKFIGKVKLANNAYVNYGTGGWQWGFYINQTGTGLALDIYSGQGTFEVITGKKSYSAAELGITGAMADTEFILSIQMWNVENENKDARFAVWVNDKLLGVYDVKCTYVSGNTVVKHGPYAAIKDTTHTSTVASYYGVPENLPTVEEGWTVLTPYDFGFDNGTYSASSNGYGGHGATNKASTWDKVILQFDAISFTADLDWTIGGSNGWTGFKVLARDGNFLAFQSAYSKMLPRVTFAADAAGVSFAPDSSYKLQITMEYTDNTKTSMKIGVWFNGVLYKNRYFFADLTQSEEGFALDQMTMGYCNTGDEAGSVTLYSEIIYEQLPTVEDGWTVLTPYDFGVSDALYHGGVGLTFKSATDKVSSLNKTIVSFDNVQFNGVNWLFIGAGHQLMNLGAWYGLKFETAGNGLAYLTSGGGEMLTKFTFEDEKAGVDIVGGIYDLKFTFEYQDDSDYMLVGVWFNDILYKNEYITVKYKNMTNDDFGVGLSHYGPSSSDTVAIHSGIWAPLVGLTNTNFGSFSNVAENTKYPQINGVNSFETSLLSGDTLLNTSFRGNLTFHNTGSGEFYIRYGGIAGASTWNGLSMNIFGDKITFVNAGASEWSNASSLSMRPSDFGLASFLDQELELGIDLVMHGDTDDMLMYFYINGKLYNDAPLVLYDFGDQVGKSIVFCSTDFENNYYQTGSFSRELNYDLYHDLSKNDFVYVDKTGAKKTVSNPGVYEIEWNDGAFVYTQTVIAYVTGDANGDKEVNVLDVVKTMVTLNGGASNALFDKAADVNDDYDVTNADVIALRNRILGKVEEEGSVMPIGGFYGPNTDTLMNEDIYKAIADLGITEIVYTQYAYTNSSTNATAWHQMMTWAQNNGIGMYVNDARLNGATTYTAQQLEGFLQAYKHFQSFEGIYVVDEPYLKSIYPLASGYQSGRNIADYSPLSTSLANAGIKAYLNAFPYGKNLGSKYSWAANEKTSQQRYKQYIEAFATQANAPYLSYDKYSFDSYSVSSSGMKEYFHNMAIVSAVAKEQGLDWRPHLQAGSNWNAQKNPTEDLVSKGEFYWNANISLAMGAKALQYFPLTQPAGWETTENGEPDYQRNGLINVNGELTRYGKYATAVNAYVKKIDDVLMNATHMAVIGTSGYAKSIGADSIKSAMSNVGSANPVVTSYGCVEEVYAVDDEYGAFVGCFEGTGKYAGKTILYVVNYNVEDGQDVEIYLDSKQNYEILYMNGEYDEQGTSDEINVVFEMGGEAALVIVG